MSKAQIVRLETIFRKHTNFQIEITSNKVRQTLQKMADINKQEQQLLRSRQENILRVA